MNETQRDAFFIFYNSITTYGFIDWEEYSSTSNSLSTHKTKPELMKHSINPSYR